MELGAFREQLAELALEKVAEAFGCFVGNRASGLAAAKNLAGLGTGALTNLNLLRNIPIILMMAAADWAYLP